MTCNSYLLVKLETENSSELDTSISYLTSNIGLSLQTLFGEVGQLVASQLIEITKTILIGAAIPFSVLSFSSETRKAILECPEIELVKLRTALTLQNSYQGST